jgi:hypothetical protein
MTPLEKRLKTLKELLASETDKSSNYAQDLKLSIKQFTAQLPNENKQGYVMVDNF